MEILIRLICLVGGYLFGMIETGFLYGKARGIDLREHGSGNVGTTNTLRTLGKRAGAIVLAGDMLKTFIPMILVWLIFHKNYPELDYVFRLYAAAGVILGHDFPFYMRFKGGKGIACTAAMILSFYWGIIPGEAVIFFGIYFLTRFVSLASIFLYIGFFVQVVLFGQAGILQMSQGLLIEVYIIVFLLMLIAINCHKQNIVRLFKGEERRTYLRKRNTEHIAEPDKEASSDEKEENAESEEVAEDKENVEAKVPKDDAEGMTIIPTVKPEWEDGKLVKNSVDEDGKESLDSVEEDGKESLDSEEEEMPILSDKTLIIPAISTDEEDELDLDFEFISEKMNEKEKKRRKKK